MLSIRKWSICPRRYMSKKMTQKDFEKHTELQKVRDTEMLSKAVFVDPKQKNKDTFMGALELFKNGDIRRRGTIEFISAALKHMKDFGVERDLEVYKSLMDVMPKNEYVPRNQLQAGFFHYPRQQDCLLNVLEQMSENKVRPDRETGELILSITGLDSSPYRKFARMRYWDSKFRNLSPFPLPDEMPDDSMQLAQLAIQQISCVDRLTQISVYNTDDLEETVEDKTWVVSGTCIEILRLQNCTVEYFLKNETFFGNMYRAFLFRSQSQTKSAY